MKKGLVDALHMMRARVMQDNGLSGMPFRHLGPMQQQLNRVGADEFVFSRINNEGILFWPNENRPLGSLWT